MFQKKRLHFVALILFLLPLVAFSQIAARYDMPVLPTTPAAVPSGSLPNVLAVTNATIAICGFPATLSAGMCTNTITTYTDSTLSTPCPSSAQLTAPGSNQCISTTGLQGALGFWYNASSQTHMTYTVKTKWGTSGPYDILQPGIGGISSGTVLVTTNGQTFTFTSPGNLQTLINTYGAGTDFQLGCGNYNITGLTISNNNIHLHGPANNQCVTLTSTGNPAAAITVTGNQVELDHLTFTGANEDCIVLTGTSQSYIHHNTFGSCGSVPSIAVETGVFLMMNGSNDRVEYNVITGNGTPMPSGGGGSCLNYQVNNILTPSWRGGTWGAVPCPQSSGYVAYTQGETNPRFEHNHIFGNNLRMGIMYFDVQGKALSFDNDIDMNNAYLNDTNGDAEAPQGYAELCYNTTNVELLSGSIARSGNTVTWTGNNGTTIPFNLGDPLVSQFSFGSGGTDFNEGGPFTVTSVTGSGGPTPTMTWNQPGPNDTATSVNVGRPSNAMFIGEKISNTSSSGIYSAGCNNMQISSVEVKHFGQLMVTGVVDVGAASLNAANNVVVTNFIAQDGINTNQNQIGGQVYLPNGIVISGAYRAQLSHVQIKNFTNDGIKCNQCNDITVTGGTIDGFGTGQHGFAYTPNQQVTGVKLSDLTITGTNVTGVDMPNTAAGWGLNMKLNNLTIYGNTPANPTSDCIVAQTPSPVSITNVTCEGAKLGAAGTMKFGIVNSANNSFIWGNTLQDLTVAGGAPYDDSSTGTLAFNIENNNTVSDIVTGAPGSANVYAVQNFINGGGFGKAGLLNPFTLQGNCNGGLQGQIGLTSGGQYDTFGCIFSTGGAYLSYNAAQNNYLTDSWIATQASHLTDIITVDSNGFSFFSRPAGICPTSGTNTFTTCFSASLFNVSPGGTITANGLTIRPWNGIITTGDLVQNDGTHLTDSGIVATKVLRNCGTVGFTASTTSSANSCAWVTASSACAFSRVSTPLATAVDIQPNPGAGTVSLTAGTSISGNYNVMCSAN